MKLYSVLTFGLDPIGLTLVFQCHTVFAFGLTLIGVAFFSVFEECQQCMYIWMAMLSFVMVLASSPYCKLMYIDIPSLWHQKK